MSLFCDPTVYFFQKWGAMMNDDNGDPPEKKHLSFTVLQLNDFYYQDTISLDISSNKLTGEIPFALTRLPFLSTFNLLSPPTPQDPPAFSDLVQMHFYEACPYLKFAHFTVNQAILEAFAAKKKVHVIDFGMKQGMEWPALMQRVYRRKFRAVGEDKSV
ncbi:hypothetical protein L1987_39485 [Smallanthus sonchifolius]|uniref:Uncharacterized protein n=1 Tax=Smallanthus sonchifolius TaxID=185202 RepID=A0ACB9HLY3_9ASTR|nr:hypothetical protein L1987_39485 [Smallanthus sonchifolius]